jgi:g-D-glutamyl-meso-diaminopimelate peptidase
MDYEAPIHPEALYASIEELQKKYPDLRVGSIGKSILGRSIPLITLGNGKSASLFVGAHHSAEAITTLLLMKMIEDILTNEKTSAHRLAGFDIRQILSHRSLYIVPMLNPDGVAIRHFGADAAGLFKKRVIAMNGNHNFSLWQANARGVDLNHNYDAEFEQCKKAERALGIISGGPTRYGGDYPESEPESGALVHLTRILSPTLKAVLALHTQGEEIYWDFAGDAPKNARMLAECFSRVSGYTVASPPAEASYGGYKDFVIREFGIPAFTIECGRGKNPLPSSDFYAIYDRVLPILLTAAAF